jgi:bacterioferritin-associated ferredoxin
VIICHCKRVTDRAIRQVVREGATTQRQVALACAAGRSCGGCTPAIREILLAEIAGDGASPTGFARLDDVAATG